jgi:hypothetical protein
VILSPVIGLMTRSRPSPSENRADLPRLFEIRFLPPGSTGPKRVAALRGFWRGAGDFWQELAIRYAEAVNGGEPLRRAPVGLAPRPYTATTLRRHAPWGNGLT